MRLKSKLRSGRPSLALEALECREMLHGDVFPSITLGTQVGAITIELFDEIAPGTVENFVKYVNDGDYEDMFFHRSADSRGEDFVIQGGGFTTSNPVICGQPCDVTSINNSIVDSVPTDPPIQNEPGMSNLRGTVAMAKTSDPNSATSQFFVNLNDNTFLDPASNGAFTVFGRVADLTAADAMAALPTVDMRSAFVGRPFVGAMGEVPLFLNGSQQNELVQAQSITGTVVLEGTVFNDFNGNGVMNAIDGGMFRRTVFNDANGNGVLDGNEQSTMTNERGEYHLVMEGGGSFDVRMIDGEDYGQTVNIAGGSYSRTRSIGESAKSLNFGMQYTGLSWQNPLINTDVDGINGTTPLDALMVINELDLREFSSPETGALPPLSATPAMPVFMDVVGNNAVGPLDANLVITNLISSSTPQAVAHAAMSFSTDAVEGAIAATQVLATLTTPEPAGWSNVAEHLTVEAEQPADARTSPVLPSFPLSPSAAADRDMDRPADARDKETHPAIDQFFADFTTV